MPQILAENMTDTQRDTYLAWLADAHAMEQGLIKTLEGQIEATKDMPEMQERLTEHLGETKQHARLIEGCLNRLGGDPSTGKDMLSKLSASAQGMVGGIPDDAHVKNMLSSYAAEHFEIASYTAIRAAAEEFGDIETAEVCREILDDERDMATWLNVHLPEHTEEYLRTL